MNFLKDSAIDVWLKHKESGYISYYHYGKFNTDGCNLFYERHHIGMTVFINDVFYKSIVGASNLHCCMAYQGYVPMDIRNLCYHLCQQNFVDFVEPYSVRALEGVSFYTLNLYQKIYFPEYKAIYIYFNQGDEQRVNLQLCKGGMYFLSNCNGKFNFPYIWRYGTLLQTFQMMLRRFTANV